MSKTTKHIFFGSDTHCGHKVGLTPPGWWCTHEPEWYKIQRAMWNWFEKKVTYLKPFDVAFWNADLIDGKGARSGGTELITTDRNKQVEMALQVVNTVDAPMNIFTYGTPYHTGVEEDWEENVARVVQGEIGGHQFVDVNGLVFDFKHKISGSTIPHGRHTAVARDRMWNILENERKVQPKSNVIARGHVHYHTFCGGPGWLGMTLPCLQGFGSKFGTRACSGTVDFGFIEFTIHPDGRYSWESHITVLKPFKVEVIKC